MIISLLENLESRCIDVVLDFPQADIKVDVYVRLPFGFKVPDNDTVYVLKLKKNLYELKDASKTFWDKVRDTLTSHNPKYGFKQSQIDPCLFIRDDCFLLVYVDDMLCFSRDGKVLDELVQTLKDDFKITDEDEVTKYLGVDVEKKDENTIVMRQPFLIERVIENLGLVDFNDQDVPASSHYCTRTLRESKRLANGITDP